MAEISRTAVLLALVGLDENRGAKGAVSGITRLQKFLFLLEQEGQIRPKGSGFEFVPYKAGPYSSRLYDDLELLENLGWIEAEATAESTDTEAVDIRQLSFEDLMGGFTDLGNASPSPDSWEERRFSLTDEGRKKLEALLADGTLSPVFDEIGKVKSKFNYYSLRDLLKYVYTKYPEMTTESEIIEKVLGPRRS